MSHPVLCIRKNQKLKMTEKLGICLERVAGKGNGFNENTTLDLKDVNSPLQTTE